MLHVILTILKIIGIVLLVILALVLALILIVLFVPIRYSAHLVKEEPEPGGGAVDGLSAEAGVTWLLHLVSLRISFKDKKLTKALKILGIDLLKKKKKKEKKKKRKVPAAGEERPLSEIASGKKAAITDEELEAILMEAEEAEEAKAAEATNVEQREASETEQVEEPGASAGDAGQSESAETAETQTAETEPAGSEPEAGSAAEEPSGPETEEDDAGGKGPKRRKAQTFSEFLWRIAERIWKVVKKIAAKIRKVAAKIRAVLAKIRKWKDFLADERTQKAIVLTLKEVGGVLKGWLPKKIRGFVRFGQGDPYKTGDLLAKIAPFYPVYGRSLSIYPDFENKTLEGDIELKGRIFLAALVGAGLKLILNKNIKYVIGFIRNKEDQQNGGE